ncbi:uncharacterized protein IWZ02DRAFT_441348 [Phyllosticta citriasiana]|uniref:uncharacterized protein n=1 Tax=Phyllosticta citriasiana TaxID=595635 RepID=UPI0030FD5C7A
MSDGVPAAPDEPQGFIDRDSLCFACPQPGLVLHSGQHGFRQGLSQLFDAAESNAAEQLVQLKNRLRQIRSEEFFCQLAEGLATITGAQYAFISKRILVDDQNVAVEMPPIGEPGSCLMAVGFYINDGKDMKQTIKNFKYHAWSCPCAYMKHDKIFVIPEKLNEFLETNANDLPIPVEAYLGVPLWAEDKCFAHFGVMWSPEGAAKRNLRWGYLEMLLHSLEDMILDRILDGVRMAGESTPTSSQRSPDIRPTKVVPHEAVTVAQSLKPYARSLSHELRTPMQGVVGMLDVMYATVQEAVEGHGDGALREVFQSLKENIEMVQDSSRRAVEAADNVVHAYDMNMGVPESPTSSVSDGESMNESEKKPDIVVAGNQMTLGLQKHKRRRESNSWEAGNSPKQQVTEEAWMSQRNLDETTTSRGRRRTRHGDLASAASAGSNASDEKAPMPRKTSPSVPNFASESTVAPGLRHTCVRDVIQYVINDSLKLGGRPESAVAKETEGGEIIEVLMNSPSGSPRIKTIEWSVEQSIPQTILIDERDLAKMISCVFLNALKFTDEGRIRLHARLNSTPRHKYIVLRVEDEGTGIPADFLAHLFKPFSREDDSLTRRSEGLGLGLLVARGLARKLGGDIHCVRSDTSGPNRGSEFELRIPITPGDPVSRSGTPLSSRSPSLRPRKPYGEANPAEKSRAPSPLVPPDKGPCVADSPQEHAESVSPKSDPVRDARPPRPKVSRSRRTSIKTISFDRELARRHPLNILVADDNMINRKLLVNMLQKLGYRNIRQAYNGVDVLRQMAVAREHQEQVDVILMDLWMPLMDGAQAARHILATQELGIKSPTILAVTADVTERAMKEAAESGMKGLMTKPFKLQDLEKLIVEYCTRAEHESTLGDDEDEAIGAV